MTFQFFQPAVETESGLQGIEATIESELLGSSAQVADFESERVEVLSWQLFKRWLEFILCSLLSLEAVCWPPVTLRARRGQPFAVLVEID